MTELQKFLAQLCTEPQARAAMSTQAGSLKCGRASVAVVVSAAFLWTLVLTVSPQLHQQIHHDANRVEHVCAVTFAASGSCEHCTHPTLTSVPVQATAISKFWTATSLSVESPFLLASIFEHAPPANS